MPQRYSQKFQGPVRALLRAGRRLGLLAGIALAASTASGQELEGINRLQDVQIGENGQVIRVALFCRTQCRVSQSSDGFLIEGLKEALTIDLEKYTKNAEKLVMQPVEGGALLSLASSKVLLRSSITDCKLGGGMATCVDLEFSKKPYVRQRLARVEPSTERTGQSQIKKVRAQSQTHAQATKPAAVPDKAAATVTPEKSEKLTRKEVANALANPVSLSAPEDIDAPQKLSLRDPIGPEVRMQKPIPDLRETTVVPAVTVPTSVIAEQPISADVLRDGTAGEVLPVVKVSVPASLRAEPRSAGSVLRPAETQRVLNRVDFREQAELILLQRFDAETCQQAQARLAVNAWALDAMASIGFCQGASGDFEKAETVFKRLLDQEPRNHEALVGRALIATITGEKSVAQKFFNDALDASPSEYVRIRINAALDIY